VKKGVHTMITDGCVKRRVEIATWIEHLMAQGPLMSHRQVFRDRMNAEFQVPSPMGDMSADTGEKSGQIAHQLPGVFSFFLSEYVPACRCAICQIINHSGTDSRHRELRELLFQRWGRTEAPVLVRPRTMTR
jgi:hypothetical protein